MQRIACLAACRPGVCAWKASPTCRRQPAVHRQWAGVCVLPARPFTGEPGAHGRRFCRRRFVFVGQKHRLYSSRPGADEPAGSSGGQPAISVVGVPDPITWIRCKLIMFLIDLYFELDVNSVEFDRGIKQLTTKKEKGEASKLTRPAQPTNTFVLTGNEALMSLTLPPHPSKALVHVTNVMSRGRYHELKGIVSNEMVEYVEKRCRALSNAQRQQLAVTMDDIILVLPEDVSVVFDQYGRKFCFIVMRFWILSTHEGPDDPEGTKIFKVASNEEGSPQKKIVTAVYEFHRELTRGAPPDWTVTTVWHWQWKLAE